MCIYIHIQREGEVLQYIEKTERDRLIDEGREKREQEALRRFTNRWRKESKKH